MLHDSISGALIDSSPDFLIHYDGKTSTLLIRETFIDDAGMFTCSANNKAGSITCSALLTVSRSLYFLDLMPCPIAEQLKCTERRHNIFTSMYWVGAVCKLTISALSSVVAHDWCWIIAGKFTRLWRGSYAYNETIWNIADFVGNWTFYDGLWWIRKVFLL